LKLADFGTFVISAAVYAAGTLGLPKITLLAYQVKIGEIPSAFVALLGPPAIFGLTLGQFIADLGVEASPLVMLSPAISFAGLLIVYASRKFSALAGSIAYVILTSLWLSFMLPAAYRVPPSEAIFSAFIGQFIAVMIGYLLYVIAKRTMLPSQQGVTNRT